MDRVPKAGEAINREDLEMLTEAFATRQKNFPDEPAVITLSLILMHIGERFAPLTCIEQEWTGYKWDIPKSEDQPKCPNGHDLTAGPGLVLGWMEAS
jgi:hypothetical protein